MNAGLGVGGDFVGELHIYTAALSDEESAFDPADYTPEQTLARIIEIRTHLREDLLAAAEPRSDREFVVPFIRYLDHWAVNFGNQLNAPLEFLAFASRNLLEFSLLLPVVFKNEESRKLFLNEALRLDLEDLHGRLSSVFAAIDAKLPDSAVDDLDWLPQSKSRLTGKRDVFDAWFHKYCSKLMHPSAIMIAAPQTLTDTDKRLTFCFAGIAYLGRSYNFLAEALIDHYGSSTT